LDLDLGAGPLHRVVQSHHQLQAVLQVHRRFLVGGAARRPPACLHPLGDGLIDDPGTGQVVGQDLWPTFGQLREFIHECPRDGAV